MLRRINCLLLLTAILSALPNAFGVAPGAATYSHPRLYFNTEEMIRLRNARASGNQAKIWKNIADAADWCMQHQKKPQWVGGITPDPKSENLYDRFYALAGDLAITEHLSFAYALSGDDTYGGAARVWVLGLCHEWVRETEATPDSGHAFNVARLLKTIAIGYDLAYERLSREERQEVRDLVAKIGRNYFAQWYQTEAVSGPGFYNNQALVEWSCLGVTALTFLGEIPEAQDWLKATIKKFEDDLLPNGLEADGASSEGGSIWASTMAYRIFFMSALRHVTDVDLLTKYQKLMTADLALASIACEKYPGFDQNNSSVLLQPSFAQLDYYAPILLFLAREYSRGIYQHLALWDHTLGHIQPTRYITPHGYQLLTELGGYAYIWLDTGVRDKSNEPRLSFQFPSVDEAYLRASWQPGDLVAAVGKGELVVNAGGLAVLVEPGIRPDPAKGAHVQKLEDNNTIATLVSGVETNRLTLELNRPERVLRISRHVEGEWQWSCLGKAMRDQNEIQWEGRTKLRVIEGEITDFKPEGYAPVLAVSAGRLKLDDPAPLKCPLITAKPGTNGNVVIEIQMFGRR